MSRHEFPSKIKARAFERANGKCEGKCGNRLYVGKFHYDHDIPDWMGGEPTLENCRVLCVACHGEKTARQDVPAIAKTKRVRLRHIGAVDRKPKSKWKRKLNGTVVLRDETQ